MELHSRTREESALTEPIGSSLRESRDRLSRLLRCPGNLGIQFRELCTGHDGAPTAVAVFVDGLADADRLWRWVTHPLQALRAEPMISRLSAPRIRSAADLNAVTEAVLNGETAVLLEGEKHAAIVDTRPETSATLDKGPDQQLDDDLRGNLAMLRRRLRDPSLVAEPVDTPRETAAAAALVYLEGKADSAVLARVRDWVRTRAGEESFRRGLTGGFGSQAGLLPTLLGTPWAGKVAVLLDVGHVAVLIDRIPYAFLAPVTAPSLLTGPGDEAQRHPVIGLKRFIRVLQAMTILLEGALIVAVMEYHQELIPTPFLLAQAAVRETAALPVVASVIFLGLIQEAVLQMPYRLPKTITMGHALIAFLALAGLLVFTGLVGPLAAAGSVLGLLATTGLVCYDLRFLVRGWRWVLVLCAGLFGLFGVSVGLFFLAAYLTRHKSFGVPFVGETGSRFTAPGRLAAGQEGEKPIAGRRFVR